jgi:hypothetical protein
MAQPCGCRLRRAIAGTPQGCGQPDAPVAKILFIIFVDAKFTTLFERLFTKPLDVISRDRGDVLPVSRAQRRLTPSQPKLDTNKKDRIARMY